MEKQTSCNSSITLQTHQNRKLFRWRGGFLGFFWYGVLFLEGLINLIIWIRVIMRLSLIVLIKRQQVKLNPVCVWGLVAVARHRVWARAVPLSG